MNENKPDCINAKDVPDAELRSLARAVLPAIEAYFESEEGKREFAAWKANKKKEEPYR